MPTPPRGPMSLAVPQPGKPPSLVDAAGKPVPAGQPIVLTAAELARQLAHHAAGGLNTGLKHGREVGTKAGVEVARHVFNTGRVWRTVERDEQGRISGVIEERR